MNENSNTSIEICKQGIFVDECCNRRRNIEDGMNISAYAATMIVSLYNENSTTFSQLFNIVQTEAPNLAAAAACKSCAVIEYISNKAPGFFQQVNVSSIESGSKAFESIKDIAPALFGAGII